MPDFPDLSHHNASADFAGIRRAGAELVILKATEGTGYTDPTFRSRWKAAKAAGLKRSAYHFARPGTDPVQCARGLYSIASDAELPLVCDWEDAAVPVSWVLAFVRELDRLSGKVSIIYTTAAFARAHAGSSTLAHWPAWIARYNSFLGNVSPWGKAMWWQYTDHGRIGPHFGDVSHVYSMPVTNKPIKPTGIGPTSDREAIRFLQVCLNLAGQTHPVTGVYGTATGQAVRNLKKFFNDYHVGRHTFDLSVLRGWKAGPEFLTTLSQWLNFLKAQGVF